MVPAARGSSKKHLGTIRGIKRDTDGEHLRLAKLRKKTNLLLVVRVSTVR